MHGCEFQFLHTTRFASVNELTVLHCIGCVLHRVSLGDVGEKKLPQAGIQPQFLDCSVYNPSNYIGGYFTKIIVKNQSFNIEEGKKSH